MDLRYQDISRLGSMRYAFYLTELALHFGRILRTATVILDMYSLPHLPGSLMRRWYRIPTCHIPVPTRMKLKDSSRTAGKANGPLRTHQTTTLPNRSRLSHTDHAENTHRCAGFRQYTRTEHTLDHAS